MYLLVMTGMLMTSCKEKLSVSPTADITFSSSGGDYVLKVKSSTDWYARLSSSSSWLSLDKHEGSGDGTITVTAKANESFNPRSSKLNIYDESREVEFNLNVTQEALSKQSVLTEDAWKCTKETYVEYENNKKTQSGTTEPNYAFEFISEDEYTIWEKEGHFYQSAEQGTWNIEGNTLTIDDGIDVKEYKVLQMTTTKLRIEYTEVSGSYKKVTTRELTKDPYWVSPDDGFQLSDYYIEMHSEDTYQIHTTGTDASYTSSNPYAAVVDENGLVTALFVGTTTIEVTANEGTHTLTVNVTPRHTYYKEPCLDFTKTKEQIKSMYSGDYYYNDVALFYPQNNESYFHGYIFDGSTLTASTIYAKGASYEKAGQYVAERYCWQYDFYDEETDTHFDYFSNLEDMIVALAPYSIGDARGSGHLIMYFPYDFSEMETANERRMAVKRQIPTFTKGFTDISSALMLAE